MSILLVAVAALGIPAGLTAHRLAAAFDTAGTPAPRRRAGRTLTALVTAGLFAMVATGAPVYGLAPLPALLYLATIGVSVSLVDLRSRRLPDRLVLPSYIVLSVLLTVGAVWSHDSGALLRAIAGGLVLYGAYFALALANPDGLGFGDVKLAGLIGAALGYLSWPALVLGALAACALGAMVGLGVLISRRGTRRTAIPFGPLMLAGAAMAVGWFGVLLPMLLPATGT